MVRPEGQRGGGWVAVDAPAKVNLRLAVLARRSDGFHELDTVLAAIDLLDRVEVRATPRHGGVRLELGGEADGVPADGTNLAVRAAEAVLARAGGPSAGSGLDLRLKKRIPPQAGLGGGSSDAAAAARASAEALGVRFGPGELGTLLAGLGSDCAFFEEARGTGLGHCTGRGERVRPLALPAAFAARAIVVVTPSLRCSTAEVYAALGPSASGGRRGPRGDPDELLALPLEELREALCNDLEPAALAVEPGLRRWRELLDGCGAAHFRLSGSGSSFFGLFGDAGAAGEARGAILGRARGCGLAVRGAWVVRRHGSPSPDAASD